MLVFYYHLALACFVLAGLQYYYCIRDPALMPSPRGLAVFHAWGILSGLGMVAMFVAGFFILTWWMPLTAWFSGQISFYFVPFKWKQNNGPGIGFISTLLGIVVSIILFLN